VSEALLVIQRSRAAHPPRRATAAAAPATHHVGHALGIPFVVELRDGSLDGTLLDDVSVWFRQVDETFGTHRPDSEISRIDRGELDPENASSEVRDVLERCDQLRLDTHGYFDVRAAGRLDPSGLVKGWAVDRAAAYLETAGVDSFLISAGGDAVARGGPWRIGIPHPRKRRQIAATLEAYDLAIATSGANVRGARVINPYTGKQPNGVLSVTVIGHDLATADAYATAAFAMGDGPAADWLVGLRRYEAMIVLEHDVVLTTPGFPDQ
jgi:thiamine biosynthesis lipoprotein